MLLTKNARGLPDGSIVGSLDISWETVKAAWVMFLVCFTSCGV